MYYVTLEGTEVVRMPDAMREFIDRSNDYAVTKISPLVINCSSYSAVSGLISAVSKSEMLLSEIRVSGTLAPVRRYATASND